jgi:mRNA interferase RelE/StbE
MATVKLTAQASKQLAKSPKAIHERITKMLVRLQAWPTVGGVKKLKGNLAGWYRARVGDYRIRFCVEGDILTVDKIGHRKDVYEN